MSNLIGSCNRKNSQTSGSHDFIQNMSQWKQSFSLGKASIKFAKFKLITYQLISCKFLCFRNDQFYSLSWNQVLMLLIWPKKKIMKFNLQLVINNTTNCNLLIQVKSSSHWSIGELKYFKKNRGVFRTLLNI